MSGNHYDWNKVSSKASSKPSGNMRMSDHIRETGNIYRELDRQDAQYARSQGNGGGSGYSKGGHSGYGGRSHRKY